MFDLDTTEPAGTEPDFSAIGALALATDLDAGAATNSVTTDQSSASARVSGVQTNSLSITTIGGPVVLTASVNYAAGAGGATQLSLAICLNTASPIPIVPGPQLASLAAPGTITYTYTWAAPAGTYGPGGPSGLFLLFGTDAGTCALSDIQLTATELRR